MRSKRHRTLLYAMLAGMIVLLFVHVFAAYRLHNLGLDSRVVLGGFDFDFGHWFNLDSEKRFGALFGTLLILLACGTMLVAALKAWPEKVLAIGWLFMSGILFFMACDEFFSIHERSGEFFGSSDHFGTAVVPSWVKAMGVIVALLLIPMGFFWWKLPTYLKIRTAIAAAIFLMGAMGVEVLGLTHGFNQGRDNVGYALFTALEEGMEMLGMIIAIDAMLLYLTRMNDKAGGHAAVETKKTATA